MDEKMQYCYMLILPHIEPGIHCNHNQYPKSDSKIYMEKQMTQKGQNKLEK